MPRIIAARPRRRGVIFVSSPNPSSTDAQQIASRKQGQPNSEIPSSSSNTMIQSSRQKPLLSHDTDELSLNSTTTATVHRQPAVPKLFTSLPPIGDPLVTETSIVQDEIIQTCLPFLVGTDRDSSPFKLNAHGLSYLERHRHVRFLHASLQALPSGFTAYDASRPWIVYWALTGLSLLGEDISVYRTRYWHRLIDAVPLS